jgi:hypothetical protein
VNEMQAIEMVVFMIASIVIGGLILLFIGSIDPGQIYATVERLVFPQPLDVNAMLTVTKTGFAGKMGACWQECAFGAKDLKCGAFYITTEGLLPEEKKLDSASLQAIFSKFNYCTDCVVSVEKEPIILPAVVRLECEAGILAVKK